MLALEQSAEKWPVSAGVGGGSSDRSDPPPPGYGPVDDLIYRTGKTEVFVNKKETKKKLSYR